MRAGSVICITAIIAALLTVPSYPAHAAEESTVALTLPEKWNDGTDCANEPAIQVHEFSSDFFILRQSLCTNFEGPFLYLIIGSERALLLDTGAGGVPLAAAVNKVIDGWLIEKGKPSIDLIVAHSHAHGDHTAGDAQFRIRANTRVVGLSASNVSTFFGLANWPAETGTLDLGGRIVDIIPVPGHQSAHIALFDRRTRVLLSGDTLYPGRLYFAPASFNEYLQSIERLADFTGRYDLRVILGAHIEMTSQPGVEYPCGSAVHPNEHRLELKPGHLTELKDRLRGMQAEGEVTREVRADFIIHPGPCRS